MRRMCDVFFSSPRFGDVCSPPILELTYLVNFLKFKEIPLNLLKLADLSQRRYRVFFEKVPSVCHHSLSYRRFHLTYLS